MDIVCDKTAHYELAALIDTEHRNQIQALSIQSRGSIKIGAIHIAKVISQLPNTNIYSVGFDDQNATLRSSSSLKPGQILDIQIRALENAEDQKPLQVSDKIIDYSKTLSALDLLQSDYTLEGTEPIHNDHDSFDFFDLWTQIEDLKDKRVSIGHDYDLIIEHTHALTTIDVNIKNYSEQTLHTLIKETMRQIQLRNISGQIVIDMPNINDKKMKDRTTKIFNDQVEKDPLNIKCFGFSAMGLFEITRERRGISIKYVEI